MSTAEKIRELKVPRIESSYVSKLEPGILFSCGPIENEKRERAFMGDGLPWC